VVVGAGACGLTAARALADHGLSVVVVDKGRGVGGRLATRRLSDGLAYDHGAALFDPATRRFEDELHAWQEEGLVAPLGREGPTFRVRGPATSLAKRLSRGLDVRLGARVSRVSSGEGTLRAEIDGGGVLDASALLLTAPVPQCLDVLSAGGLVPSLSPGLREGLRTVRYRPAFVLLLRLAVRLLGLPPGGVLLPRDGGCVSRVLENAGEGGASRLSVYARESWAAGRFETPPDEVSAALAEAASRVVGFAPADVLEQDLKRWRYARPEEPIADDATVVEIGGAPIAFAGDAFGTGAPVAGNTGVERAVLSGLAAACRILERHGAVPTAPPAR
jgi:hypothetical protein